MPAGNKPSPAPGALSRRYCSRLRPISIAGIACIRGNERQAYPIPYCHPPTFRLAESASKENDIRRDGEPRESAGATFRARAVYASHRHDQVCAYLPRGPVAGHGGKDSASAPCRPALHAAWPGCSSYQRGHHPLAAFRRTFGAHTSSVVSDADIGEWTRSDGSAMVRILSHGGARS
jgi:hypothetical protein